MLFICITYIKDFGYSIVFVIFDYLNLCKDFLFVSYCFCLRYFHTNNFSINYKIINIYILNYRINKEIFKVFIKLLYDG